MIPPIENGTITGTSTRNYTLCGIALLIVVLLATAASWRLYPVFVDTFYHMGVIEGFSQAGGITTRAFWEMAPGGRVHIYPPSLHVIGYYFSLVGVSPRTYITLVSVFFYVLCMFTTWIWLREIIGARSALFAVIFLCGPYSFFWTQASFNAVAGVMVLAPLAFLMLETERFLACGVINFIAITTHPMGLFLPPALVINTILRRKKIIPGLIAASLPVVLYGPWLAHIWANRAYLPDNRTGSDISLGTFGEGSTLGIFMVIFTIIAVPWLIARRGPALGLVGALLGFAVVFPMGFGGRFLAFNIHWPLACLAGYGLGELVRWLEQRNSLRIGAYVFSIVVAGVAIVAYPAISFQSGSGGFPGGPQAGPPGGPQGGPQGGGPPGSTSRGRLFEQLSTMLTNWQFSTQSAALPKLFDSSSADQGMMMPRPGGGGPGRQANQGPQNQFQNAGPGRDRAQGRGMGGGMGRGPQMGRGGGPGMPGWPGGGGGPGAGMLTQTGADDFFNAVKANVQLGDIIHIDDPMQGSMIVGVTGKWTTSGILRDVRSDNPRAKAEDCDFKAVFTGGGMGPGPGRSLGSKNPPSGFEQIFKNDYAALYKNKVKVEHNRLPYKPDVSLPLLIVIAIVGFLLVLVDYLPLPNKLARPIAGAIGTLIVVLCFLPLISTAIGELRNPPPASQTWGDEGPGFGPPGLGGPGTGPGQFIAREFLKDADAEKDGSISLDQFRGLAEKLHKKWDIDKNGNIELVEFEKGLQSIMEFPMEMNGPPPFMNGPPGFGQDSFIPQAVFKACDANADGKITRDEMNNAFEQWFREWSGSKDSLNAEAIGKGLDIIIGPPPMPW